MNVNKFFNVNIEFDENKIDHIIEDSIEKNQKGYVCAIESNNLTVANKSDTFNSVVNNSLVNICDGSVLALILGKIHNKNFKSLTGNDLFIKYINKKKYKHYFLGNTEEILKGLKKKLSKIDANISEMTFQELPFKDVDNFDYKAIAEDINLDNPDMIWVSLGAPKQEFFMSKLLPYLNRGVLCGIGASFNFNAGTGHVKRAPLWMRKIKTEWLYRAFEEPQKNVPRYWNFIKILPSLIQQEITNKKKQE